MNKVEIYKKLLENISSSMEDPKNHIKVVTVSTLTKMRKTFILAQKISGRLIDSGEAAKEDIVEELTNFLPTIYNSIELLTKEIEAKRVLNEN